MLLQQVATSCIDYLRQLGTLICDPISNGNAVVRGCGEPVLLIPGFFAGDVTMLAMARWLSRIGYRPYLSGIDWNIGCPNLKAERLAWRLEYVSHDNSVPVVVIGHSLGGLLARFLGAIFPDKVRHVITLGAPVRSSVNAIQPALQPTLRLLQNFWQLFGTPAACGSHECSCEFGQTVSAAMPRKNGVTAIFSKEDDVVDWHACVDPQGRNIEVSGGHTGLIVNPAVYRTIAQVLAACGEIKSSASCSALNGS